MTDADEQIVRDALGGINLTDPPHPGMTRREQVLAHAALDRLVAENEYLRQYADRGDFVVYRAEWDALVAERDAAEQALEAKAAEFLALIGDVEAERDRLREALTALVGHIDLNGGCHRGCPEHDMARKAALGDG